MIVMDSAPPPAIMAARQRAGARPGRNGILDLRPIRPHGRAAVIGGLMLLAASAAARAQDAPPAPPDSTVLPETEVFGATPMLGSGIDRSKIAGETHVLNSGDVTLDGTPNMMRALNEQVGGVSLGNANGNPFQENLVYHGFQASPLIGNSQGIAVYVNGVRFNQPFGDTVNWDLIPSIAIDTMNLEGTNPVFGLNALGGALSVQMKNGFNFHGAEADVWGGSFATSSEEFQYGKQIGNTAVYLAGTQLNSGGWRDNESSALQQLYGDIGWRGEKAEIHLSLMGANNRLNNPATVPVQLLDAQRTAVFTAPNNTADQYGMAVLSGSYDLSPDTSVQANAYVENLFQRVTNGNVANGAPCSGAPGFLCESQPNLFLTGMNGAPIRDFLNGGPYSQLNLMDTNTDGFGTSVQLTNTSKIYGHGNHFVVGASVDGGFTHYTAGTLIGGLNPLNRFFTYPGVEINQADGSMAPVNINDHDVYYGLYFLDIFDITPALSLNVSGRFNVASITLTDHIGNNVSGQHSYAHFNPAAGLTYKVTPAITAYASVSESNRVPTPAELSCASPSSPCTLTNFFVGDPNLKQVIADTVEAGVHGQAKPFDGAKLDWHVSAYRTQLHDDIIMEASQIQGSSYFQNIPGDLRQGVDLGLQLTTPRVRAWIEYAYTDAVFQNSFLLSSPNNPAANANGDITVRPGNQLPGIPPHMVKLGAEYHVTDAWTVGAEGVAASGQYLFGDEANLNAPTGAYFMVGLNTSYQVTKNFQIFGQLENAFNAYYTTYGTFSPTAQVPIAQAPGASNPRSYTPASPIAAYGGVRVTF